MLKQKGFTLIEIVIVILILGIMAAIAIPHFMDKRYKKTKPMNPLQQVNGDTSTIHELEPGVYEIWLKDVNKYIKIRIEDAGG